MVVEDGSPMVLQVDTSFSSPGDPAAWFFLDNLNKTELENRPSWTQGKRDFC